jgi:amino acid transporter
MYGANSHALVSTLIVCLRVRVLSAAPIVAIIFFSLTTAALVLFDFSVLVEIESLLYCLHVLLLAGTVVRLRWKGTSRPPAARLPSSLSRRDTARYRPLLLTCLRVQVQNPSWSVPFRFHSANWGWCSLPASPC